MKKTIIYSAFSERPLVHNPLSGEPSRTKQEFKSEVDINEIIARMRRGIQPPAWMTSNTPHYGDFSNMPTSFSEAYNIIETAEAAFKSLPLEFRRALDHNPANLQNAPRELYEQFGLLKKPDAPESLRDEDAKGSPEGQGDRDLPGKASADANKRAQKRARDADE